MNKNKKTKSNKAQGHVEMILSFVIFLSFLVLLFSLLNPSKNKEVDETIFDVTKNSIFNFISGDFNVLTIVISTGASNSDTECISIPTDSLGFNPDLNIIVFDANQDIKKSNITTDKIFISFSNTNEFNRFYKIYNSNEFSSFSISDTTSCTELVEIEDSELDTEELKFKLVNNEIKNLISNKKISDLENLYSTNYVSLKNQLNINNEFSFIVYELNQNLNGDFSQTLIAKGEKNPPFNAQVLSRDYPISMINSTAGLNFGIINIRTW